MADREKGVATVPCPNCGNDLPVVEQADGSVTGGACPKCYKAATKAEVKAELAAADHPAREKGTDPEEKK